MAGNQGPAHVGIDFGTSTTLVAKTATGGHAEVLHLGVTHSWMPSVAWVGPGGELVVGEDAEQRRPRARLIRSVKRCITENRAFVPMSADGSDGVEASVVIEAILRELVRRVHQIDPSLLSTGELHVGCPAVWDREQRRRFVTIANSAGLDAGVDSLIDEPIAAAVSWVRGQKLRELPLPKKRVLVFDYGGGTLDVAVVSTLDGEVPELTVESAEGVAQAGDVLDEGLTHLLAKQIATAGFALADLPDPQSAEVLLALTARDLKETLSTSTDAQRLLGSPYEDLPALRLDRAALESTFDQQLDTALGFGLLALRSAELRKHGAGDPTTIRSTGWDRFAPSIGNVLLAGGLAQVPLVAGRFRELLPASDVGFDDLGAPQESVVMGLAYGGRYFKLNLHRPGFDIWAAYYDARGNPITAAVGHNIEDVPGRKACGELVFPAFSPLYSPDEIQRGMTDVGRRHQLTAPKNARLVELVCRSVDGAELEVVAGGERKIERLLQPIEKPDSLRFKLYTTGSIIFGDTRRDTKMRIAQWPYLKSRGYRVEIDEADTPFYDYSKDYRLADY